MPTVSDRMAEDLRALRGRVPVISSRDRDFYEAGYIHGLRRVFREIPVSDCMDGENYWVPDSGKYTLMQFWSTDDGAMVFEIQESLADGGVAVRTCDADSVESVVAIDPPDFNEVRPAEKQN